MRVLSGHPHAGGGGRHGGVVGRGEARPIAGSGVRGRLSSQLSTGSDAYVPWSDRTTGYPMAAAVRSGVAKSAWLRRMPSPSRCSMKSSPKARLASGANGHRPTVKTREADGAWAQWTEASQASLVDLIARLVALAQDYDRVRRLVAARTEWCGPKRVPGRLSVANWLARPRLGDPGASASFCNAWT